MTYPGGKNAPGVYQTIINQMLPHAVYIEAFAGSGAVLRNKRPALSSIAIDTDAAACADLASLQMAGVEIVHGDALTFLRCYPWKGGELVYCDPPYLMETRSSQRAIYRHEFGGEAEHLEMLSLLLTIPAALVISGYASRMYDEMLAGWRRLTYPAMTRGGRLAEEVLWMNYPEPAQLHDYRYLGSNFRERERIKRKKARWTARLRGMPALERYAMLAALEVLTAEKGEGACGIAISGEAGPAWSTIAGIDDVGSARRKQR